MLVLIQRSVYHKSSMKKAPAKPKIKLNKAPKNARLAKKAYNPALNSLTLDQIEKRVHAKHGRLNKRTLITLVVLLSIALLSFSAMLFAIFV